MTTIGVIRSAANVVTYRLLGALVLVLILCAACEDVYVTGQPPRCNFDGLRISSDYAGGRVDGCAQSGPGSYIITLSPENSPINHSPWYAFRVDSDTTQIISVTLVYTEHEHRYKPKLSADGDRWQVMPASDIKIFADGKRVELSLTVGPAPLWVSAQELFDNDDYEENMKQWAKLPYVQHSVLGKSVEGRTIDKLETVTTGQQGFIVLLGRQHPPEVTGALAMTSFIDRVFAADELAARFRGKFGVLVVPNINPDGVYHGNWRHNVHGVDLNRDWGPFAQPETRLMRDELARFQSPGAPRLYLFLDFHSTAKDVLYTQLEEMETSPPKFAQQWISALQRRADSAFPDYEVHSVPGHNPDQSTAKNYMYDTFGIPSITFELGDETNRKFIAAYSAIAAEEMMKNLLGLIEK